jgi:hypothetical protein
MQDVLVPVTTRHAGGRPTKYDPKFVDKVYKYLRDCKGRRRMLPKRVDVALLLDVDEDTLNNWANARYPLDHEDPELRGELKYPEFLGALSRVDSQQKSQLIDHGLYGLNGKYLNSRLFEFLLERNHGMLRTERTILAGDKDEPIQIIITEEDKSRAEAGEVIVSPSGHRPENQLPAAVVVPDGSEMLVQTTAPQITSQPVEGQAYNTGPDSIIRPPQIIEDRESELESVEIPE